MGRQVGSDTVGAELRAATDDDTRARPSSCTSTRPAGRPSRRTRSGARSCRVREAGKPVVVSMGDVGGVRRLLHRLPRRRDRGAAGDPDRVDRCVRRQVRGRRAAGAGRPDHRHRRAGRPLADVLGRGAASPTTERARLAATIDAIYDDFVGKVAAGRGRRRGGRGGGPWPGLDRRGTRSRSGWSTSSAACGTRSGSLGSGRACARTPRCCRRLHVPPLARLGRAKNSEDPRAMVDRHPAEPGRAGRGPRPTRRGRAADAVADTAVSRSVGARERARAAGRRLRQRAGAVELSWFDGLPSVSGRS